MPAKPAEPASKAGFLLPMIDIRPARFPVVSGSGSTF